MHRRCAFVLLTLPVLALVSPISPATAVPTFPENCDLRCRDLRHFQA